MVLRVAMAAPGSRRRRGTGVEDVGQRCWSKVLDGSAMRWACGGTEVVACLTASWMRLDAAGRGWTGCVHPITCPAEFVVSGCGGVACVAGVGSLPSCGVGGRGGRCRNAAGMEGCWPSAYSVLWMCSFLERS